MYRFHRTPYLNAILVFTAYTVITTSSLSGHCVEHTKSPVPLMDAYVTRFPSSFWPYIPSFITPGSSMLSYVSEQNAEQQNIEQESYDPYYYSSFLDDSYSSFLTTQGLEGCTAIIPASQSIPAYLGAILAVSATAAPSTTLVGSPATVTSIATLASSSTPGHDVHHTRTITLSVVLPTLGFMILLLCFVIIRRYRKKRRHSALAVDPKTISDTQLYLDQKAELEDDQRRRHELEAGRTMHEMDGQDTMFEMTGDNNSRMQLALSHRTHELRGPDHTQELEVPGNV